jgi:AraC-like DNA-binding protein
MRAIAALLDSRTALGSLRRSLPTGAPPVLACRSVTGLEAALRSHLLEAMVLGSRAARLLPLDALRSRFPAVPLLVYGVVRSEDAGTLLGWQRLGLSAVVIEGVDDPAVGDLVMRHALATRRAAALAEAPRVLRLSEPLQQRAWGLLLASAGRAPPTAAIARALGLSREHLSRQFGAGGAPNLKRVADLLSVYAALVLLANPGYSAQRVSVLLGYATASHLRAVTRRITGLPLAEAVQLSERELLARFVRLSARSRK